MDEKLNLVNNGIFPIIVDLNNNPIEDAPESGLSTAGTVQGEGKLLGVPSLFIRTSGCNLRCAWENSVTHKGSLCDTAYSSFKPEKNKMLIENIVTIINNNNLYRNIKHIVISGGEPLLQTGPLTKLCYLLSLQEYHITLETNGTLFSDILAPYINLVSISPKLSSSAPKRINLRDTGIEYNEAIERRHNHLRLNLVALQSWINFVKLNPRNDKYDIQLKFVVSNKNDIDEIFELTSHLKYIEPSDVILMPEGTTIEALNQNNKIAIQASIEHGWRFTPRLHIELFGNKRSV